MKLTKKSVIYICNGFVLFSMRNRWINHGIIKLFIRCNKGKVTVDTQVANVHPCVENWKYLGGEKVML